MADWVLSPGDTVVRKDLHDEFGGKRFGGIGDSAKSPNIFCFTDPATGQQHGYNDGWVNDGLFQYTGEGQIGDQEFRAGNAAILRHADTGRAIRLFHGTGGLVTYMGEFRLDVDEPYVLDDAPETNGGPLREVIIFRLRPVDAAAPEPQDRITTPTSPGVSAVAIEEQHTERFLANPASQPVEVERREQRLVLGYGHWLRNAGHTVVRHRYVPELGAKPLFSDLFDETRRLLVEAKGSVARLRSHGNWSAG